MNSRLLVGLMSAGIIASPTLAQSRISGPARRDSVIVLVRSDSGNAVAGALVATLNSDGRASERAALTNGDGRAAVGYPGGRDSMRLHVSRIGYIPTTILARLDTALGPLRISLTPVRLNLGPVCTTDSRPAIQLLPDSLPPQDATLVTLTVRDSAYEDWQELRIRDWRYNVDLARERPGTYAIEVAAEGYQAWRRSGVIVTKDECHVRTQVFRVRLIRAP